MMRITRTSTLAAALSLCLLAVWPAWGSDILKERRWAEQLTDSLLVGEALYLQAEGGDFLAVYTPAAGAKQLGGVILLHGLGAHPDWPDIISPLRQTLPESGWATLSLQLPILPNDARFEEYLPLFPAANERISAGIEHLRERGILNVALVGHSLGAAMGANFLAADSPGIDRVRAFAGIGMGQRPGTVAHTPDTLAKIRLPVLDMYGSQDLKGVLTSAKERAKAGKRAGNTAYRQTQIMGADHFFRGLDDLLLKQVSSWLTRYAPSTEVSSDQMKSEKP